MRDFIEALHILAKYMPKGLDTGYFMSAEHDIIYIYVDVEKLPEDSEDGQRLLELGFHLDESSDSWAMFT